MVLDEPTNDLDMDTLDLLQEVLDEYEGTVLIVSHDRDFMDKVATSLLYMKGDGTIYEHVGSYTELLDKLKNKTPAVLKKSTSAKEIKLPEKNKPLKLSYKEQYQLNTIPAEIEQLEQENKGIEIALGNPNLYTDDPQKFDELTRKLEQNKNLIAEKENIWFEIQLKQEEINSAK